MITKQEMDDQLSHYSSLFDISSNTVPAVSEDYRAFSSSRIPQHHHARTISSESGSSSTVGHRLISRSHPSITAYKHRDSSPEGFLPLTTQTRSVRYNPIGIREQGSYLSSRSRRLPELSDDEDSVEELEPLRDGASEKEKVDYKRRQNTLAARRSRRRRAKQLSQLQEAVEALQKESTKWKTRSEVLCGFLASKGITPPTFDD